MNSLQLLPNNQPYRMAANNYYLGHARLLTMMALSIDPSDDPPVSRRSRVAAGQLAAQLHPGCERRVAVPDVRHVRRSVHGSQRLRHPGGSGAGFGLASGGLPPEGMLYGHSFGFILAQLLSLQTAGFNNAALSGPQVQLIGAPMWDRYVTGYISSLTPTAQVFAEQPGWGRCTSTAATATCCACG